MRYPDDVVEEVRSRSDILDVVSGYVRLQKKGSNYFGLCPFHNEKSPSFSVSPSKQLYYCFGCGAGGNVFTFLMNYENISFQESVKTLADRAGIALPEREMSAEERQERDLRLLLQEIHKEAGKYFYYQLKSEGGKRALDYLTGRGLTMDTIRHFGLGYSLMYRDDLYRYLKSKGYADAALKESGLFHTDGKGFQDKFWNRVMFPIMDVNGKIIGFGGRVMGEGKPKYLNSPETKLFDKSRNLYGLNYARSTKRGYIICCEGYMDVIAMHQAGYTNAVASLGTALTSQQALLLKRYTSQVILAYDSDGAGVNAAMRAIPIMRGAGMSVRILDMKPCKDPDEFMKTYGPEEFEKRIENAENFFLFQARIRSRDYDMKDPERKTAFYRELARMLLAFPDELERNTYLDAVCDRFQIPKDSLKKLVVSVSRQVGVLNRGEEGSAFTGRNPSYEARGREEEEGPSSGAEEGYPPGNGEAGYSGGPDTGLKKRTPKRDGEEGIRLSQRALLTWLVNEPKLYEKLKGLIGPEDFTVPLYQEVARRVFDGLRQGEVKPAEILNHFINDDDEYREVAVVFHTRLSGSMTQEETDKAITDTVRRVKNNSLKAKGRQVRDFGELQQILKAQKELDSLHITLS